MFFLSQNYKLAFLGTVKLSQFLALNITSNHRHITIMCLRHIISCLYALISMLHLEIFTVSNQEEYLNL